ncbi:hypothetical protein DYD21_01570 [Rhodohalobacter sp. SW132]|uniref:hypothetical protein n=1 Tax=Rhodohalobacter sp. SW132 TaxID=2293433 RepID=UPI000E25A3FF|nr:hypothetical protein [Rhodohalobacter sp. SW132]REL38665.1 hypothetical protein DYD21_01570 [Rhodohalobacter sp. SW132]
MALISKISRLNRIPELLNKKRDAERDAKQRRENDARRPVFSLNERPSRKRSQEISGAEVFRIQTAKSLREGIGRNVDLFA